MFRPYLFEMIVYSNVQYIIEQINHFKREVSRDWGGLQTFLMEFSRITLIFNYNFVFILIFLKWCPPSKNRKIRHENEILKANEPSTSYL
jgi:hypothetical protein